MKITASQKYTYRNVPIPGGGYVTGFLFDKDHEGTLFLRTDIGGTYRWNPEDEKWESLINHVTMEDLRETFPLALARANDTLFIVSGLWRNPVGKISVSKDNGVSFTHYNLPFMVHGNLNGRGTGPHLAVDIHNPQILYFASQTQGLWISEDEGKNWQKCNSMKEDYLTMVSQTPDGKYLIVGGAGVTTSQSEKLRGHSVYVAGLENGGKRCSAEDMIFTELYQPEEFEIPGVLFSGHVAQRCAMDEKYLYITFQVMGPNARNKELGYSCDNGSVMGGKLIRYDLDTFEAEDITPPKHVFKGEEGSNPMDSGGTFGNKDRIIEENHLDLLPYGLSGVSACKSKPGLLAVSSLSKEDGDVIFRSFDYGETWEVVLYDLAIGVMDFRTEYMKPQYNGGHNLIHWMSDVKINPFNPAELWFNTGTGPFRTENFLDLVVHFSDWADGIEETVHINAYSPRSGEVKLIDIVGDLGGFAFRDLNRPCDNSFADAEGNRYITCLNADYSDENTDNVIVTARGNWTGKTKGGLIFSNDGCQTFRHVPQPYNITPEIDELLHKIDTPNVNPGWVALSPKADNVVWSVCDRIFLPADKVVVSHDGANTFKKVNIYGLDGEPVSEKKESSVEHGFKAFSDRINNDLFYGFGDKGEFYVSCDGGGNFYQKNVNIQNVNFALVDTANKTEIRAAFEKSGVFYMALNTHGMWKLEYDAQSDRTTLTPLTSDNDIVYRLGTGAGDAIYIAGVIDNIYGFYRTCDEGKTFTRINDNNQMFGEINSIAGDGQTFGRFYLATGSRGIIYGEPN